MAAWLCAAGCSSTSGGGSQVQVIGPYEDVLEMTVRAVMTAPFRVLDDNISPDDGTILGTASQGKFKGSRYLEVRIAPTQPAESAKRTITFYGSSKAPFTGFSRREQEYETAFIEGLHVRSAEFPTVQIVPDH